VKEGLEDNEEASSPRASFWRRRSSNRKSVVTAAGVAAGEGIPRYGAGANAGCHVVTVFGDCDDGALCTWRIVPSS